MSPRFVRHLPGWYAQKHPDEDWAETFAVWMTPGHDWRADYADWPVALAKLEYCDRLLAEVKDAEPLVTAADSTRTSANWPFPGPVLRRLCRRKRRSSGPAWTEYCIPFSRILVGRGRTGRGTGAGRAPIRRLERQLMGEVSTGPATFPSGRGRCCAT